MRSSCACACQQAYGGPEVDPVTLVRAIEAVAHSDGGAGWCTMIASTTSSMASLLPEEAAREIYGDRNSITGGVFAPNGKGEAVTVDGVDGFSVSGRWAWGSGTQHCQWVLGGALCDDGTFRLCWFPQSAVTFHDTWYTTGMRGSGSLDYSVHEVFVPASSHHPAGGDAPGRAHPAVAVPELHAARRRRVGGGARRGSSGARRTRRPRPGQEAAVLVEDTRPERVHPDRGGAGRGQAARRPGVPARRVAVGVGHRGRRRRRHRRGPHRHPAGSDPRRDGRRRGRRRGVHAGRWHGGVRHQPARDAACATPTS